MPLILVLRPIVRRRRVGWLLALEGGTAMIIAGWVRSRQPVPALLNAAALAGFACWYLLGDPGRRTRTDQDSS